MIRPRQVVGSLAVAARNADIRRAELAWGASVAAEWAHFVALGVFAYDRGGTSAVGMAGLVRLLPAAVIAPFAASLGDRFRARAVPARRVAWAVLRRSPSRRSARTPGAGSSSSPAQPASASRRRFSGRRSRRSCRRSRGRPTELIASNGATSTIESLGTLIGPLVAGVLVAARGRRHRVRHRSGGTAALGARCSRGSSVEGRMAPAVERPTDPAGLPRDRRGARARGCSSR